MDAKHYPLTDPVPFRLFASSAQAHHHCDECHWQGKDRDPDSSPCLCLALIGCWIVSQWGIIGVATATTIVSGFLSVATTLYFSQFTGLSFFALLRSQASPFIASIFMYGMVSLFRRLFFMDAGGYSYSGLLLSIAVGVIAYVGAFLVNRPASVVVLLKQFWVDVNPAFQKSKWSW